MPEITRVRERRGRAWISVDGEYWAEIDADVAAERGLREGVALSHEELQEARVAGERALAMARALNYLGYRARSEREVRERILDDVYEKLGLSRPGSMTAAEQVAEPGVQQVEPGTDGQRMEEPAERVF